MSRDEKNIRTDIIKNDIFLASNIKYLRKKNRLSQEKLGKILGYERTTIGNWETGCRVPDIIDLFRLSRIFEVSLDDLMGKNFNN